MARFYISGSFHCFSLRENVIIKRHILSRAKVATWGRWGMKTISAAYTIRRTIKANGWATAELWAVLSFNPAKIVSYRLLTSTRSSSLSLSLASLLIRAFASTAVASVKFYSEIIARSV